MWWRKNHLNLARANGWQWRSISPLSDALPATIWTAVPDGQIDFVDQVRPTPMRRSLLGVKAVLNPETCRSYSNAGDRSYGPLTRRMEERTRLDGEYS